MASTQPAPLPSLSVVVVSFNGPHVLRECLAALVPQARAHGSEVLVVANWRAARGPDAGISSAFPDVRWVPAPTAATVPALRRLGIKASRGSIVALLEDDCVVGPGWCDAVIAAHRTDDVAVGGAVEPGPYQRGLDWAVYFCEYSRFMPPIASGPAVDLPGNNVAYKRDALEALPDSPSGFYDVFVHRQWAREGRSLRSDAALVVRNVNSWTRRHVTSVPFHHGRAFAGQRSAAWPLAARAGVSLLALLLPLLSAARIMRNTVRRRRHAARLLQALPWIVLFTGSWSLGEAVGYLLGPGDSPTRWR